MKKTAWLIISVILIACSSLFAVEARHSGFSLTTENHINSYPSINYSFSLALSENGKGLTQLLAWPNGDHPQPPEILPQQIKDAVSRFSLVSDSSSYFHIELIPFVASHANGRKYYSKSFLEIAGLNMTVWTFDRYIRKAKWAYISFDTIIKNLRMDFYWDIDAYEMNQWAHPYHGAIFHSVARNNGFSFFESTVYTAFGTLMWEIFLESIPPSTNDLIMTTFGGVTLGEALYRMAGLVIDQSSTGLERALREALAFFINPAFGFRFFNGEAARIGDPPGNRYYAFELPVGAYISSTAKPSFLIAMNLEYNEFLKKNPSEITPYDWFTIEGRVGLDDNGFHDKELFTTGIIAGRKVENALAGLFGVFDYVDTHVAERISALGLGPGLVAYIDSESDLFFNSSGVISVIFGGSSPSFELEDYHFGKKINDPYYLGPGMLGRFNLEFGKKGLGSIHTGFSKYWVYSMIPRANEFLTISSLNLKCDVFHGSQISVEYDHYLRNASLKEQRYSGANYAIRALYVLKF